MAIGTRIDSKSIQEDSLTILNNMKNVKGLTLNLER